MARVVLAEPWFGGSHRSWAEGLARHSSHDIGIVGLSPQLWRWRLRAGAAPLAELILADAAANGEPDLLLVSGLVDVAALLGHLRWSRDVPVVTYMHESQLLYPTAAGTVDQDAVMRNVDSWRASDQVWFNSGFHRSAVLEALPDWAEAQPESLAVEGLFGRFQVVSVGVEPPAGIRSVDGGPPVVLWPHRWEPDKRPEVFVRALRKLAAGGLDFRLILAGDDPQQSQARAVIMDEHAERLLAVGPFGRADYERHLFTSDLVVSCAEHEFFGIAVVEAAMAGCVPVLPDALSYPELIPAEYHGSALYPVGTFGGRLVDVVANPSRYRASAADLPVAMQRFAWSNVVADYDTRISELVC